MKDILDWQIPDPKGKSIEEVRRIRDDIEIKVKELVKKIGEPSLSTDTLQDT
jgi:protein-tyrosine-phosphatase